MAFWAIAAAVIAGSMPSILFGQSEPWPVVITNCTSKQLYAASYYVPMFSDTVQQVGQPLRIGPRKSVQVERPYYQFGYYRYFLFADTPAALRAEYTYDSFFACYPKYAGAFAGNHFYVDRQEGSLRGHNSVEWYFWHPVIFGKKISRLVRRGFFLSARGMYRCYCAIKRAWVPSLSERIRTTQTAFWDVAHRAQVAHVRIGNELCHGEQYAFAQRRLVVQHAMRQQFDRVGYVPKIALISSGGGYRALFYFLGFLVAAQQYKLLDMIMWVATLSGSSWALNTLLTYAIVSDTHVDIAAFIDDLIPRISGKHIVPSSVAEFRAINNLLLVQAVEHQAFTSINIAGAFLANRLFSFLPEQERQRVHLSQQAGLIETGAWPIPIYTAAHYDPQKKEHEYEWMEFTPWEMGSPWLNAYVPAWAVSRSFENGVSTDHRIEKSLGYLMGIFGSGFAAQLSTVYGLVKNKLWMMIKNIVEQTIIAQIPQKRLWWGQLPNFTYGIKESPLCDQEYIDLLDAGFAFNIPYPPISSQRLGRSPDIIIVVDASTTLHNGLALRGAQEYARRYQLPFPPINYTDIGSRAVSIFSDPDFRAPTIIYMPAIVDQCHGPIDEQKELCDLDMHTMVANGPYNIANFVYSRQESMRLIQLARHNTQHAINIIFKEIEALIIKRSG